MIIKRFLLKFASVRRCHSFFLQQKNMLKCKGEYTFVDRGTNAKTLCIVLAGYKEYLYPATMPRLKRFSPSYEIDICLLSAGRYSPELEKIAHQNNWSYLYTKEKSVSLIQNIAINLHKSAEYIYKIDEDIFITKNFFEAMKKTYNYVRDESVYFPGFISPTIPINGFGYCKILEVFEKADVYKNLFEMPKVGATPILKIESDPETARFFWGGTHIPKIDEIDRKLATRKFSISPCPTRFSIGAIFFARSLWEDMGMFEVKNRNIAELGRDEVQICSFCMLSSRAMIISENTAVGHLSFGKQNEAMKQYFFENPKKFYLEEQ